VAALLAPGRAVALQGPSAGAASTSTIKLPDGPGSVRGLGDPATMNVFSAQVGYQIPIDLPAGRAGLRPRLALRYSGALGNGPIGIGWTFDLPAVRRSDRHGVPAYDGSDELELVGIGDGGRLVRDPDRTSPQQYWVEGKGSSINVVQRNGRFEITDAAGARYFLGNSSASREEQDGRVSAWMLDWVIDLGGNEITYNYTKAANRLYLASIVWGPVSGGNPVYRVEIEYEARTDAEISYRTGFPITTSSRVKAIRVRSFDQTLRTYHLRYDDTFALTRLRRVDYTGSNDQGSLPSQTFSYGVIQRPELVSFAATNGWMLNERGVAAFDVDGDGMADLLRLEAGNHQYLQGRGNHFGGARPLAGASDVDLEGSALLDLDGDARPELVRIVNDTWRVYRLVDSSWESLGEWPGTRGIGLHAPDAVLVDLNGDGRVDVVRPRVSGVSVNFGGATGMGPTVARPALSAADATVEPGRPDVRFLDMNGDGLADVVWLTDAWMKIFLGRGDGTFVPFSRTPYPWGGSAAVPLDHLLLDDLNRDGLVDLVRIDAANVTWFRGETDGRFGVFFRHLARPEAADADAVVTVTDINGNGSQDVVWSSPRGLWAIDLAGATSAGMLTRIENGLGMSTTFSYDASGVMAVAADRSGAPWQVLLPVSVPIPVRVETDPGAGGLHRVVEYTVRDGFWDGVERRFGGFLLGRRTRVAAMPADNQIEETRFLAGLGNERVLRGVAWYVQEAAGSGAIFSVARTSWVAKPVTGLPPSPLTRKAGQLTSQLFLYEGVPAPIEMRTTYELDGEVRTVAEHHLGRVDTPGDEKVVRRDYRSQESPWVRDVACQETVFEADGVTVASDTRRFYGDASPKIRPCGELGNGWVRSVEGWVSYKDIEARWVEQSTIGYDAYGNVTSKKEQGVIRNIGYDPLGLFPMVESILGPPPALVWSANWDQPRGVIVRLVEPNGDYTGMAYDEVGRPTSVAVNGITPHIVYEYDWSAPTPKTTTRIFDGTPAQLASEGSDWIFGVHARSTTAVANGAGEPLYATTPLGSQVIVSGWKERDERGQVVRSAEPFYSTTASPSAPAVGTRAQLASFDSQGRVQTQTFPNGAIKSIVYRALGQTVNNPELGPITTETDGLSRIVRTQRAASVMEVMTARYDAAGRITQINLQDNGAVHRFDYDTLGRLRFATDPDIGDRVLSYDDRNLLIQHTNGVGQSIFFDYDFAARLVRRGETATTNAGTDYVYVYDDGATALGPGCQVVSRLASVREPAGEVRFCYDALGRQIGMGRSITVPDAPTASGSQSHSLSLSGLLLGEQFDDGFATVYQYDRAGRTISISSDGSPLWTADEIDAAGRVVTEHYGNGATQAYAYDALGLAQHVKVDRPSNQGTLYDVWAERNDYGAPKIVTDQDGQGLDHNATFTYDPAGRLTDATLGSGSQQYAFTFRYDPLQNMTFRGVTGPQDIGVLVGQYKYGERGYGPRQLTSVVPGAAP
jgi:YD repeat-containing protein